MLVAAHKAATIPPKARYHPLKAPLSRPQKPAMSQQKGCFGNTFLFFCYLCKRAGPIPVLVFRHAMISNITIQQFATGDRRAFEAVFRHYYPKVRGFLVGMLKNEADAEDVAQTVFIRLWTKRERITDVACFDGYLYRMSRNAMMNFLKNRYAEAYPLTPVTEQPDATTPQEQLIADDLRLLTDLIVSRMPDRRREVFRLSRQAGLTNEEIAQRLGISKKTVENHLNMALGELRRELLIFLLFVNELGAQGFLPVF